jgi:uncharacterized protein with PIN domain
MKGKCPYCDAEIDDMDFEQILDEVYGEGFVGIDTLYEDWKYKFRCPECNKIFGFGVEFKSQTCELEGWEQQYFTEIDKEIAEEEEE